MCKLSSCVQEKMELEERILHLQEILKIKEQVVAYEVSQSKKYQEDLERIKGERLKEREAFYREGDKLVKEKEVLVHEREEHMKQLRDLELSFSEQKEEK